MVILGDMIVVIIVIIVVIVIAKIHRVQIIFVKIKIFHQIINMLGIIIRINRQNVTKLNFILIVNNLKLSSKHPTILIRAYLLFL